MLFRSPVVFSVADRVRYTWEASTTPTFTPESQIARVGDLVDTTLDATQPVEPLFTKKVEAEGTQTVISNTCGAGDGWLPWTPPRYDESLPRHAGSVHRRERQTRGNLRYDTDYAGFPPESRHSRTGAFCLHELSGDRW